jgi:membrane protein implicated in regulation of membrane protease activity
MNFFFLLIPEFTSEMLFFTIFSLAGLFFLLIGWLLNLVGGDLEMFGDTLDIETPPADSDFLGDVDIENFSDGLPIPSFFSLKILRIVMLCFGLGGNVGLRLGFSFYESLIMATATGFISGYIVYKIFIYIYSQTIYNYRDPVIIGREGKVTLSIPSDGYGQIIVYIIGQRFIFRAKSADNSPINEGKSIKIVAKEKATCSVEIL